MFENLANREVLTALVGFAALALVAIAPLLWFVIPRLRWRRDRHLTPKDGEVWRSPSGGTYHFEAIRDTGGLAVWHDGRRVFAAPGADLVETWWSRLASERLLYRAKEAE